MGIEVRLQNMAFIRINLSVSGATDLCNIFLDHNLYGILVPQQVANEIKTHSNNLRRPKSIHTCVVSITDRIRNESRSTPERRHAI